MTTARRCCRRLGGAPIAWWRRVGIAVPSDIGASSRLEFCELPKREFSLFSLYKKKTGNSMLSPRGRLFFLCTSSATSCSARSSSVAVSCLRSYPSFGSAAACSLPFQRARQSSSSSSNQVRQTTSLASFSTSAPSSSPASNVTSAAAAAMGVGKTESSGIRTMVWFRKVSLFALPFFHRRVASGKKKTRTSSNSLPPSFSPSLIRACASTTTRP